MGLKKLTAKIAKYSGRVDAGDTNKIKPEDVSRVLAKLHAKEAELAQKIARAETEEKRARFQQKLHITQEHIERAKYLLDVLP